MLLLICLYYCDLDKFRKEIGSLKIIRAVDPLYALAAEKGILKKARHVQKKFDFLKALMYINKRIQDYKSLESQNAVFTPKDKKMTLDCQNFETCGIKKVDQKKYNKYVPKPFA